jgi:hypothetical protein
MWMRPPRSTAASALASDGTDLGSSVFPENFVQPLIEIE